MRRQNLGPEMLHGGFVRLMWAGWFTSIFKSGIFNKADMVYWHFCKNGLFCKNGRIQRNIEFHIWVNKLNRLQRLIMSSGSHVTFPSVDNSQRSPWSSDENNLHSYGTSQLAKPFHPSRSNVWPLGRLY